MKNYLILFAFLFCFVLLFSHMPAWEWASQAGGSGYDYGRAITTDTQGNQYISGYVQNVAYFDSYTCVCSGLHDLFTAKMDSNGNFLRARRAGGTDDDYARGIAVDDAGNIYVTGYINGTAQFGSITLTSSGSDDIVVVKLNSNGNILWAKRAGGATSEWGYSVAVDAEGYVYLTGHFTGTATFGEHSLTASGFDIYVAKLDSYGNWLWAMQAGGKEDDFGFGLALDAASNIYVTGYMSGTAIFGDYEVTSIGGNDIFVTKLDTDGNFLWAKKAGGTGNDYGFGIAIDTSNHVCITGRFMRTAVFGDNLVSSSGGYDIFAAKLNSAGNFLWVKRAGGSADDRSNAIATDAEGNMYLSGYFSGTAYFGDFPLYSHGSNDIFAA